MQQLTTIYNLIANLHPLKLDSCIRKGDISSLLPVPLSTADGDALMQYAKKKEADKLTPPYRLSDYLCYMYEGNVQQFADQHRATVEDVEQAIYSGLLWHNGAICHITPAPIGRPKDMREELVQEFAAKHLTYGEGRVHTTTIWQLFELWCHVGGKQKIKRRRFGLEITKELANRGYTEQAGLRIDSKVTRGYMNISVKYQV